jgi:hypothetical protein
VSFIKESNNFVGDKMSFIAKSRILFDTPFDLIGCSAIKRFNLGLVLLSHFFDEETSTAVIRHYKSLLPGPLTVDSLNSGEKTNDGQALP